ncbi:MAG TPA: RNA 2',3'-cyclic phosphodiesterase [Thermoanaerobaculia bacterium]|nr:RNA 2',3'-cyclic phosphodiesterase [Thermoanaerobaculia bacterium]
MRLFIATNFPGDVLHELNERVSKLKPRLPAASWVREETQHLTFAFLGEQPEALVETIATPLTTALAAVPRFEARLHASGFFPNPRHARVGWIGLEPEQKFIEIARVVRGVVERSGVKLDGGDFKPHLTMMRMREGWPPASIELFTKSLRDYTSEPFTVDAVTLFSSQLHPKGAIHTPMRVFPLAV